MRNLILLLFLLVSWNSIAQKNQGYTGYPSLIWPKLYDVKYENVKDELGEVEKPLFSSTVKQLEGKVVTLPGYIVPFTSGISNTKQFILTSLPLNACFFCGVGGPETVIEIQLKSAITYTDKLVEVKGILRLNDKNPDAMIYRLEQAEFLGEIEMD